MDEEQMDIFCIKKKSAKYEKRIRETTKCIIIFGC